MSQCWRARTEVSSLPRGDITAYLTRFERRATLLINEEGLAVKLGSLLTGPRLYHVNLLKRYIRCASTRFAEVLDEVQTPEEEMPEEEEHVPENSHLICLDDPRTSAVYYQTHGLALKISKCHFGFPGLSKDWPLLCCPGFTLYLLPGAVNESASSVGEISVPLALTCSGGILVFRGDRPVMAFRTSPPQLAPATRPRNK
ncbi:hypothetical protein E2C01_011229 [Portunus trituberculatus]|uniref:Uncharacterized protein n=1 Tax=Portunus trituberculatus TaxID=210409 RepID=A0A5B7DAJ9_PORTR|nr:hypothetical protein [Portunus trituberculatus]